MIKDHSYSERRNPLPPLQWVLFAIRSGQVRSGQVRSESLTPVSGRKPKKWEGGGGGEDNLHRQGQGSTSRTTGVGSRRRCYADMEFWIWVVLSTSLWVQAIVYSRPVYLLWSGPSLRPVQGHCLWTDAL